MLIAPVTRCKQRCENLRITRYFNEMYTLGSKRQGYSPELLITRNLCDPSRGSDLTDQLHLR